MNSIFNFLRYHPDIKVELGAHTDIRGDDEKNLALSQYRANRLKEYFIKQTINSDRLVAKFTIETKSIRSKKEQREIGRPC